MHVLEALDIDRGFRLDAKDAWFCFQRFLPLEHFIDRGASEFQVLLELVAREELRLSYGIERSRAAIGRQRAYIDPDAS